MSEQTITITDNRTGKNYTLPVEHGGWGLLLRGLWCWEKPRNLAQWPAR